MTRKQRELLMKIDEETINLHIKMDAALRFPSQENERKYVRQSDIIKTLREQFIECED